MPSPYGSHHPLLEWFIQMLVTPDTVVMLWNMGRVCHTDVGKPRRLHRAQHGGRVLLSVAPKLVNSRVHLFTDIQNVAHILLHAVALKVFNMLIQYQIRLEPEWIPREWTSYVYG